MDEAAKVVDQVLKVEYEVPTCKVESCLGCKAVEDCEDAKKYIRNALKKRLTGVLSHEEFMKMNDERFGLPKPKIIKHWKQILGAYERDYMKVVNDPKIFHGMELEAQDTHRDIEKQLLYNGWTSPKVEDGKLKFMTIYPKGTPVNKEEEDFIPEIEELTPQEVQAVLF